MKLSRIPLFIDIATILIQNFIPIYGVILHNWNVTTLVMLYWIETLIIGVLAWRKLPKKEADGVRWTINIYLSIQLVGLIIIFGLDTLKYTDLVLASIAFIFTQIISSNLNPLVGSKNEIIAGKHLSDNFYFRITALYFAVAIGFTSSVFVSALPLVMLLWIIFVKIAFEITLAINDSKKFLAVSLVKLTTESTR